MSEVTADFADGYRVLRENVELISLREQAAITWLMGKIRTKSEVYECGVWSALVKRQLNATRD